MSSSLPSFGLVGGGWRAEFFLRIARDLPDLFPCAGIVMRDAARRAQVSQKWGLPAYATPDELLSGGKPDFVVTSVPWGANSGLIELLVEKGASVLSETPIAPTLPEMVRLAALEAKGARIQVAEQYSFQPHHAAALAVIRSGRLGTVREVDISAAHGYHGISLLRHYLEVGLRLPKITARKIETKIIEGPDRSGPPTAEKVLDTSRVIAHFDYGDRFGLFDFTGDQYFSWIRSSRRLVRGERGEISQNELRFLQDFKTPIRSCFSRRDTGHDGNLEGYSHADISVAGEIVYANPFPGARWSDDEIAVATCISKMQDYIRSGTSFYSVAEACHDRYLDLLIDRAVAEGAVIQALPQPWCPAGGP